MSKSDRQLNRAEKEKRLGLLGLAANRQIAEEPCPGDEQFATFLESDPASPEQQHFISHVAACESCREKWLVLSEELDDSTDKEAVSAGRLGRRGLLSIVGTACGVALGVMLYLSIDYHFEPFDGGDSSISERMAKSTKDQDQQQMATSESVAELKKETEIEKLAEADAPAPALEAATNLREQESRELPSTVRPETAGPSPAEAPLQPSRSKRTGALTDEEGFTPDVAAMHYPTHYLKAFEEFIDSFVSFCDASKSGVSKTVPAELVLEQGRTLLDVNGTMAPSHKELIGEIIQLLSGSEPVKDTELDLLCKKAGRVLDEIAKAPH